MDRTAGPWAGEIGADATLIEIGGDFPLWHSAFDEHPVHPADRLYLVRGPKDQNDAISLDAFILAPRKFAFRRTGLGNQDAAQPVSGRTSLPIAKLEQPAMAGENLY